MKGKLFLIIISFMILSCNSNENRKHENYLKAVQNQSTVQNFIVVKVKNLNTNETKEICTKGNFLLGAIHLELNKKYDSISRKEVQIFAESKTDLSFEFKNKEALKNISFYNYDASLLNNPKVKAKVKLIEKKLETQKDYSVTLANNEMIAVACELFKKGYPSAENTCFGGNLIYYQRTN